MTDTAVALTGVTLAYGPFIAVKDVDLAIDKGSFVTLLGPSGCGKTTILRAIAGLVSPTSGEIIVEGRLINDVPIYKRNIGLVFQNYALFPHKTRRRQHRLRAQIPRCAQGRHRAQGEAGTRHGAPARCREEAAL